MTEPLLDPEDRAFEEELLRAGRDVHMSKAAQAKTLAALGIGTIGVAAGVFTKAGAASFWSSKAVLFSMIGAVTTGGALAILLVVSAPEEQATTSMARAVSTTGSAAKKFVGSDDVRGREVAVEKEVGPGEVPAAAESTRETAAVKRESEVEIYGADRPPKHELSLGDEVAHLGKVESALAGGRPREALKLLDEYRERFPTKRLGLEAEIFTIQALHDSGSQASARVRAAKFLQRHPTSPLGVKAKQYLK